MPASCTGMKTPANWWFCSSSIRATISAFPTAKPRRQPAIPYDFDIEKSSKPTSRAPSTARKLAGLRPSKTRSPYAKSCITHAPRALRPLDRLLEDAGGRARGERVRRVVEVERGGRGRRRVPVGAPVFEERERHVLARPRARRRSGSRDSRDRAGRSRSPRSTQTCANSISPVFEPGSTATSRAGSTSTPYTDA